MNNNLIAIDKENIISCFEVRNKQYCAFITPEGESDDVYFALISAVPDTENIRVMTSVPDEDLDAVVAEYEQYIKFLTEEDELSDIDYGGDL